MGSNMDGFGVSFPNNKMFLPKGISAGVKNSENGGSKQRPPKHAPGPLATGRCSWQPQAHKPVFSRGFAYTERGNTRGVWK